MAASEEPSSALGQVLGDLEGPRGADGAVSITVLPEWFETGARLIVQLPRRVVCATCEGGGCDVCGRSGALLLPHLTDESVLSITLPSTIAPARPVTLRVPGRGMPSLNAHEPAGHLLLRVVPGPTASASVTLDRGEPGRSLAHLDRGLVTRSTVMAILLIAVFLGLLRLSGWM
jgi:hypothetical protein